jgi:hypothetical protein
MLARLADDDDDDDINLRLRDLPKGTVVNRVIFRGYNAL